MRLLFIHGRAQEGKDTATLKRIWTEALKVGAAKAGKTLPDTFEIDFPYYGDALDTYANEAELPKGEDVLAKGDGANDLARAFATEVLIDLYDGSDLAQADVDQFYDSDTPLEKGPLNSAWLQAIVQAIDRQFPGLSEKGIELLLRDVFLYVRIPFVTDGINEIVEKLLTPEPTVVVGHSLGTVVGYNVIRKNRTAMNLKKYITLGSPLGIKAIAATIGVPSNTAEQGWYNAYDERDIVALNPLAAPYFKTDPAIENNNTINNTTPNRHGIVGYLQDPTIAWAIADALNSGDGGIGS